MLFVQIYFFIGIAMVLVVLWDFKAVPQTANRYTKRAVDRETEFAPIVLAIRNLLIMTSLAFFIWPAIIWWEIFGNEDKL
jgi:hypothetical protein